MKTVIDQLRSQVAHYEALARAHGADIERSTQKLQDAQAKAKEYQAALDQLENRET